MSKISHNSIEIISMICGCIIAILFELFVPSFTCYPLLISIPELLLLFIFMANDAKNKYKYFPYEYHEQSKFKIMLISLYFSQIFLILETSFSLPFFYSISNRINDISIFLLPLFLLANLFFTILCFINIRKFGKERALKIFKKICLPLYINSIFLIFFITEISRSITLSFFWFGDYIESTYFISFVITTIIFSIIYLFFALDYKEESNGIAHREDTFIADFMELISSKNNLTPLFYGLIVFIPLGFILILFSFQTVIFIMVWTEGIIEYIHGDYFILWLYLYLYISILIMYFLLLCLTLHSVRIFIRRSIGITNDISLFEIPTSILIISFYIILRLVFFGYLDIIILLIFPIISLIGIFLWIFSKKSIKSIIPFEWRYLIIFFLIFICEFLNETDVFYWMCRSFIPTMFLIAYAYLYRYFKRLDRKF